ncbi:uncharacterized protein LOC119378662, partial [Rhipicephalus sanguineus]|uniref:uncharacterized protein LOC119378662 n=1 Tax=Rhipicephalus sanguineus TaxID=34632 RepID=UPI0020C35AB2
MAGRGKPPSLDNLGPISLTSCVGNVVEHAILNRVSRYLEDRDIYPHNMIGFRPGLLTQEVMKLIKDQVINPNTRDIRAILGLDLERGFDNALHHSVLSQISCLGVGKRFDDYTKSFLTDREANLKVDDLASTRSDLASEGRHK